MARALSRRTRARGLLAALLMLGFASSAAAQNPTLTRDYDLVRDNGLVHYSQADGRWAFFPMRDGSRRIGECGCLLAAFATVLNYEGTGMLPWFPTRFDYFGGSSGAFDFNPRYLDIFLMVGPTGGVRPPGSTSFPVGWGYKSLAPGDCGTIPLAQALQSVGTDGLGSALGFTPAAHDGFGPDVKRIVDRNLAAGRPTIVAIRDGNEDGPANHAVLIAGWDNEFQAYRILDPRRPRAGINGPLSPQVPLAINPGEPPTADASYEKWEGRVRGIIEMRGGGLSVGGPSFVFGDDPSPIEILMTGPDGRRTGMNPGTGASFEDNDGASYWTLGPWLDPLAAVPDGTAPRFITYADAPSGRYDFTVTATADGPLDLTAETLFGGTRERLGSFLGTMTAGEVRKYELAFSRTGASSIAEVPNFTPHAYAGNDIRARTDASVAFDGRASFDADGAIASFQWDFGDGVTATGPQPQHVYTVPGDYAVTLTVTDADGATATDSLLANVILSQRRPVAAASGPYLGFASSSPEWYVLLDARGSTDPNGDPLTYRWDFGDGSPTRTTGVGFVDHLYGAVGVYTVTLIVNDGIDDSAPATARVEIVQVPTAPPSGGAIVADLTPSCGTPGTAVTIAMGEFAQFQWWDFGAMGALPAFPPARLVTGFSAPDGTLRLTLPGGEREYVPFQATLLSPGRFSARATFTVPDVAPGAYDVIWSEDGALPFEVPCPPPTNRPPRADAGGPYAGRVGSTIAFDGSASSDPDGDALTYDWDFGDGTVGAGVRPTHSYANEGQYLVSLMVSDGRLTSTAMAGSRSFVSVLVSSGGTLDTIPPVTTAVPSPPADASGWNRTDVIVDLNAVDDPGGSGVQDIYVELSGAQTGAATVPGAAALATITRDGATDIDFFATDNAGNRETPQRRTIRIDRTGPTISGMPGQGCVLWPPNHRLVTVADVSAADGLSGLAGGLLITVTSNEPINDVGDGNTGPDFVIAGGKVALRVERSGTSTGRIYTITATATDRAGNTTQAVSTCVVPHDQGH
jgi:PKD repeat protein